MAGHGKQESNKKNFIDWPYESTVRAARRQQKENKNVDCRDKCRKMPRPIPERTCVCQKEVNCNCLPNHIRQRMCQKTLKIPIKDDSTKSTVQFVDNPTNDPLPTYKKLDNIVDKEVRHA